MSQLNSKKRKVAPSSLIEHESQAKKFRDDTPKEPNFDSPTTQDDIVLPAALDEFLNYNSQQKPHFAHEYDTVPISKRRFNALETIFQNTMRDQQPLIIQHSTLNLKIVCSLLLECFYIHQKNMLICTFHTVKQEPCYYIIHSLNEMNILLNLLSTSMNPTIFSETVIEQFEGLVLPIPSITGFIQDNGIYSGFLSQFISTTHLNDIMWLKLLKNAQWWLWWGPHFPTEFVYLVAKCIAKDNLTLLLHLLFNFSNWSKDDNSIECPMQLVCKSDSQIPQQMIIYLDMDHHLPFLGMEEGMVRYDPNFSKSTSPVYVIQQGIGHIQFHEYKNTFHGLDGCKQEMATLWDSTCTVHELKIRLPLMILVMINDIGSELLPMWHNILHHLLSVFLGFTHVEKRNQELSELSNTWYKNLTGHQLIFNNFLNLGVDKTNTIIDQSFRVGIQLACGFIDSFDWLTSFFCIMNNQTQSGQSKLLNLFFTGPSNQQTIFERYHSTLDSCKSMLTSGDLMTRVLSTSIDRHTTGQSLMEVNNSFWKVVLNSMTFSTPKLILYSSIRQWFISHINKSILTNTLVDLTQDKKSLPLPEDEEKQNSLLNKLAATERIQVSETTGYNWRPNQLTHYQANVRKPQEIVYLTHSDINQTHHMWCKTKTNYIHPNNSYTFCEELIAKANLTWLQELLIQLFQFRPHTILTKNPSLTEAFKQNLIPLSQLLTKIYVEILGYSLESAHLYDFSCFLNQPETFPPTVMQYLVDMIAHNYFEQGYNNILTCLWAPYIPASSLVLDTFTFLYRGKSKQGSLTHTDTYRLMLFTTDSHYIVLDMHYIYGITFDVEVVFHSGSPSHHQHLSHTEFSQLLKRSVFMMQHYSIDW